MPGKHVHRNADRGQAYTLEGFIGAMIVLMAVLLALQSVVITPTTGGATDRAVQAQIQQEIQDALVVASAAEEDDLSYMLRYWDGEGAFNGTEQSGPGQEVYDVETFGETFALGEILSDRFAEDGHSYNVELRYPTDDGEYGNQTLVYQGSPAPDAVTASYTVTLYDNQTVTSDESDGSLRGNVAADSETIPDKYDATSSLYNVVEVRVILW
ncbi:DUF7288 family protein [Natronobacterium gregoryi]|uniref:Uncharacterized protein n=2 Tax=Natronobacterium gregoryi TaxID=44930 RepID=L0AEA4_NATGS|nr:hypothetical protein [Natronobacterium gregoryi]AFZ71759.1 hypothetical protein Natgr_0506 [Natronobacterium gregoryi SP2]ELY72856.1 hypothetical protein C490_02506 [Natronobacterium gregoryi SP2]PLK21060.1 hypothetical protein CYV19_06405 [Natronobacterium gregoryi SP2]SFI88470.1 hypothetical protein SAMN05443661_10864 [Natronobacterium gregoryi]